jgi:hypothetical protein
MWFVILIILLMACIKIEKVNEIIAENKLKNKVFAGFCN